MTDIITLAGSVGGPPTTMTTATGLTLTKFRLASKHQKIDQTTKQWVDTGTSWYDIVAWRKLGDNVAASVKSGDRVIVTGKLTVTPWQAGEKSGLNIEVNADSVGHDLLFGTTVLTRGSRPAGSEPESSVPISDGFPPAEAYSHPDEEPTPF